MQEKTKTRISKVTILLSILCIIAIGASIYFYLLYTNKQSEAAKQQQIVDKIARTVELPSETPLLVTVSDKNLLTNKQLATKVDNGDMLLVFSQAKRLIIYRPSNEKVMNMLSFENSSELPTRNP